MIKRPDTPPDPASTPGLVPESGDVYQWPDIEDMVCQHCGTNYGADENHTEVFIPTDCPGCAKSCITLEPVFIVKVGEGRL